MDLILKDDTPVTFDVVAKDKFGVPTKPVGPLTVTSSDETIAKATLSADESQVVVEAAGAGKLGSAVITVADAAANGISSTLNVTVVAGSPASIELDEVAAAAPAAVAPAATPEAEASAPAEAAAPAPAPAAEEPATTAPAA